jgi:hypothetical protein
MLNSAPCKWTITELKDHFLYGPMHGAGQPARPYGLFSFHSRLELAWAVFTGKADALFWPGDPPKAY